MLGPMPRRQENPDGGSQATSVMLKAIGMRLRTIRKSTNLPQTVVCQALGVDQSTWSKWEQGQRLPDLFTMIRFASRAKVSLDLIYRGVPTGVHHGLLQWLQIQIPDLLVPDPTGTDQDKDKALASYRTAINLPNPVKQDALCAVS